MKSPISHDVKQGKEWLTISLESDASILVGAIAIVGAVERRAVNGGIPSGSLYKTVHEGPSRASLGLFVTSWQYL